MVTTILFPCVREVVSQFTTRFAPRFKTKRMVGKGGGGNRKARAKKKSHWRHRRFGASSPLAPLSLLHPCLLVLQTLPAQTNCMPSCGREGEGGGFFIAKISSERKISAEWRGGGGDGEDGGFPS